VHRPEACEIITTHNSFHGRTLATMAATGKPGWDKLFKPNMPGFRKVPFGDIDSMRSAINAKTLAVMVEPIQGEAGVIVPPQEYVAQLRELTMEHGILLILDEIQTGVGRLGSFFAFEQSNIRPDIVTLGKGLGGGVPISATLAEASVCCFESGDQGGTYNGNPLMTAVSLAVVNTVANTEFLAAISSSARKLESALKRVDKEIGLNDIRGNGLLWAIDLPAPIAHQVQLHAMEAGLLINAPRPSTIRLMPALNVTDSELDEAVLTLSQAIEKSL